MEWNIDKKGNFPVLRFDLQEGESIKSQPGSMLAMNNHVELRGKIDGGFFRSIFRKFSGETFFIQHAKAISNKGWITLSTPTPGDILEIKISKDKEIFAQKDSFLASTLNVDVSTKVQSIVKGIFSGEGLFIAKIFGEGTAFLETYGSIYEIEVKEGEEIVVDNSNIVAWESSLEYDITRGGSGWVSSLTTGAGFVCKFKGTGKIWAQSCNLRNLAGSISPLLKNKYFNTPSRRK